MTESAVLGSTLSGWFERAAVVIACTSLLLAGQAVAQDVSDEGYPAQPRQVGTPYDINTDLDTSFPKSDSLLPGLVPEGWGALKESIYAKYGLKVAASYHTLTQYASNSLTDKDVAAGGWFLLEWKLDLFRRGKDYQGGIVAAFDLRHVYGNRAAPLTFGLELGAGTWATDAAFLDVDPYVSVAFWEQWFQKDRFVIRLGQQSLSGIFDFFRFKDVRTSFSNGVLNAVPATIRPDAAPGFGVSFEWWPIEESELYVVGTVNDMNASIGEFDWTDYFETGDSFFGLEVGYNWKRSAGDFDHLHLNFWYAMEPTRKPWPAKPGFGMKLAGEKQFGSLVTFGNYTFNDARGGGFAFTNTRHSLALGLAYVKPLGIRGEVAISYQWGQTFEGGGCGINPCDGSDQHGSEIYWKLLVTPDLWVTPGVQFVFGPAFNTTTDFIAIPQIKARLFF